MFSLRVVQQNVINFLDFSLRPYAELPHRRAQREYPYGRAYGNVAVFSQIYGYILYRHRPAVHAEPAAPPESERSLRALRSLYFIYVSAQSVRRFVCRPLRVSHAGKIYHQPRFVAAYVFVLCRVHGKAFLPHEHIRRVARACLRKAEYEIQRGHHVQREYNKLYAYPKHERNAEHAAQYNARFFPRKKQPRRSKIAQPVHYQQRYARKYKILKHILRKRQHLKIRQHRRHAHRLAGWVDQHLRRPGYCAYAYEQRPEHEPFSCCFKS